MSAMKELSLDLECPDDVTPLARKAHKVIVDFLVKHDLVHTGGCRAFHSPGEWAARGEEYGTKSLLVVCHDGGEVRYAFSYDAECYTLVDGLQDELKKIGVYAEQCTSWYSAVYRI